MPASIGANGNWYIYEGGRQRGPFSRDVVTQLLHADQLSSEAQLSCGGPWLSRQEATNLLLGELEVELIPVDPLIPSVEPLAELPYGERLTVQSATPPPLPEESSATPAVVAEPQVAAIPEMVVSTRDRIVVIGRRAAGKTIYLSELYQLLWRSRNGLAMKALSGRSHKELMAVHETLRRGEWPQATEKTTVAQMEFELDYRGRKRTLVSLDYAGEVFRDAFVNDDTESPQAKALVAHIDRACAVILLIDPSVAVSGDTDAAVDDDYGIVQAIQRIRDWPDGGDVPIVLLLTKSDQNRKILAGHRSIADLVKTLYPALVRTLKRFKAFQASAVQTERDSKGRRRPKADSVPMSIIEPLQYCLDSLDARDERRRLEEQQLEEQRVLESMLAAEEQAEHRFNVRLALLIGGIITMAICVMALILVFLG